MDVEVAKYVTFSVNNDLFDENYYNFLDSDKKKLHNYIRVNKTYAVLNVPSGAKYLSIRIGSTSAVSGTEYKLRIKVEKGNKLTDYSLSQEDIIDTIQKLSDRISSLENK